MKTFKEKNGFTLIELLAVIVVLAIVMVMATTTVLPFLSKSRYNAFAIEVNAAKDAASQVMSLVSIGSLTKEDLDKLGAGNYSSSGGTTCFSLEALVKLGPLQKDIKDVSSGGKYAGKVEVSTEEGSRAYKYKVTMHSDSLYVNGAEGTISGDDYGTEEKSIMKDYKSSVSDVTWTCES